MADKGGRGSDRRVAVYWDFENLVISHYDLTHAAPPPPPDYRRERVWARDGAIGREDVKRRRAHEAWVNLDALLAHAAKIGSIVVNRTYCDWSRPVFDEYGVDFAERCVELVQMFSTNSGKNGADIRIALEVVEDLQRDEGITDVVLFTGDGDFVPVADLCRALGKTVHGVGVKGSSNSLWKKSCKFWFYDTVVNHYDLADSRVESESRAVDLVELLRIAVDDVPPGQLMRPTQLEPLVRRRMWSATFAYTPLETANRLVEAGVAAGVLERVDDCVTHRHRSAVAAPDGSAPSLDVRIGRGVLAIYWDFEDIVITEYEALHGRGSWHADRVHQLVATKDRDGRFEQSRVGIASVLKHANAIGSPVVNRFYADWAVDAFGSYSLLASESPPIEFVHIPFDMQLSADIALPRDVLRDLDRFPRITDVLVCSGTNRFAALAHACIARGRSFHMVGNVDHGIDAWQALGNFTRYGDLVDRAVPPPDPWEPLLIDALKLMSGERISKTQLMKAMQAKDCAFDSQALYRISPQRLLEKSERAGVVDLERDGHTLWVTLASSVGAAIP